MQNFKVIAIRPLKGCESYILKRLVENQIYYLSNDYKIISNREIKFRENTNLNPLSSNFFQSDKERVSINISAIVGKNGDGKSSLIELVIRLLNNLAIQYKLHAETHKLLPVPGLKAELYYSLEDKIYCLSENEAVQIDQIAYIEERDGNDHIVQSHKLLSRSEIKAHFFYTLISNYSLYAYNVNELVDNEGWWINEVFHKNDSYQTPVVLHPMRTNGNIEVNIEHFLSQQRLLSLFIYNKQFRTINNGQIAEFALLKKETESKLIRTTLKKYFEDVKYLNLLSEEIELANKLEGTDKVKTLSGYKQIINQFEVELDNKAINTFVGEYANVTSDVSLLFSALGDNAPKANYNIAQLQRLQLLRDLCSLLSQNEILESYTNFDDNSLLFWYNHEKPTEKESTTRYILYKIIQIFEKYPEYNGVLDVYNNHNNIFSGNSTSIKTRKDSLKRGITILNKDIKEKSHITLKLRQAINYLITLDASGQEAIYADIEDKCPKEIIDFDSFKKQICKANGVSTEQSFLIPLNELKYGDNSLTEDSLAVLPPPIFMTDILISHKDKSVYTSMRLLSSGERQMLNAVSAIIYHLRNIQSVPKSNNTLIKYNNINIILEEIELYFHPEYQRRFVKYLIDTINNSIFERKNKRYNMLYINIMFVTHSPFILSDIPKQNVLFLKEGIPNYDMQENTFGANIHSILKNGFFLDTLPIGDFAHDKINEMFRKLNSGDFDDIQYKQLYQDILVVGEPYLRAQLLGLYNSYKIKPIEKRDAYYQKRISELEQRLIQLERYSNNDTLRKQ